MNVRIEPVAIGDKFWVMVRMDGGEPARRGPFSAGEAEAEANRAAAICRALFRGRVTVTAPREVRP